MSQWVTFEFRSDFYTRNYIDFNLFSHRKKIGNITFGMRGNLDLFNADPYLVNFITRVLDENYHQ